MNKQIKEASTYLRTKEMIVDFKKNPTAFPPVVINEQTVEYVQWGEQVFDTLSILQVFPPTKHVEVCDFYHRYTSTVSDVI